MTRWLFSVIFSAFLVGWFLTSVTPARAGDVWTNSPGYYARHHGAALRHKTVPSVMVRSGRLLAARLLFDQNKERISLGLDPFAWDGDLEANARSYAHVLAVTEKWQHSADTDRLNQGENLWMGTRGAYSTDDMVDMWLAERSVFKAGVLPNVSTTGNFEDVGHYTQIIWPGSRRVGCAIDSSRAYDYLVCRYSAPGNYLGQYLKQG